MWLSIFYAQVFGLYLFLVSLAMLVHQQRAKKTMGEFLNDHSLVSLSGALGLVIGLIIVVSHNIWVSTWPVVVTVVGWIVLVQALMRIFFPETFIKLMKELMAKTGYLLMTWIWLLVGIFLIWAGFAS